MPEIPFVDVVGRAGAVLPAQIVRAVPKLNDGVNTGFTVTVKLAVFAHWLLAGVNVYVPEEVLETTEGFQVPVIPFTEVAGSVGTLPLLQIVKEVPKLKVGVVLGVTVTNIDDVTAH